MDRRAAAIAELEGRLGHVFADRDLLERALTHASVGSGARKVVHNERLEFLGDRVLALVIAEALLARDPEAEAGPLSKRLHLLVAAEACAEVGRDAGPGSGAAAARRRDATRRPRAEALPRRRLRSADRRNLPRRRPRDSPRAGAGVLVASSSTARYDERSANPKSRLQEWAAAAGRGAPAYRLVSRGGPDHAPHFTVEVVIADAAPAQATAGSLRGAEKAAALALLEREGAG